MIASAFSMRTAADVIGWLRPSRARPRIGLPSWNRRAALLELAARASLEARAAQRAGYGLDAEMLRGLAGRLEWTASTADATDAWDRVQAAATPVTA